MIQILDSDSDSDSTDYVEGVLKFSDEGLMGNTVISGENSEAELSMTTGYGAVSQSQLEAVMGFTDDYVLDGNLSGTKVQIDATSGSGAYATTWASVGDTIAFDYSFDTNDYSPYKDFSWYSVNNTVKKIVALGEDVQDFGKAKGTIYYTLSESDFSEESYIDPFSGDLAAYTDASGTDINGDGSVDEKDLAGGGELVLGFGVMDALDTCVDSALAISNINVYDPSNADELPEGEQEKTVDDINQGVDEFTFGFFGNVTGTLSSGKYGTVGDTDVVIEQVYALNLIKIMKAVRDNLQQLLIGMMKYLILIMMVSSHHMT